MHAYHKILNLYLFSITLLSFPSFLFAQDSKADKKLEKLKQKHASWNKGFIITFGGDTLRGKIKKREDYSTKGGWFSGPQILFAYPDEHEDKIPFSSFTTLCIPDDSAEFTKYITIPKDTNDQFERKIYRVIRDGKCMLLFDEVAGQSSFSPVSALPIAAGPVGITAYIADDRYFIYYKGKLTKMREEGWFAMSPAFKKKRREIFSDCPNLVDKIENKTYKADNLREIVEEFNQCLDNVNAGQKY